MQRKLLIPLIALSFSAASSCWAAADAKPATSPKAADEIVLSPDAPQLASLKIETVAEIPAPVAPPLNGKIIFNENYTARVSSPIAGRALKINAEIGDNVKAGQGLMILDSPELGSALADARKANADLQLKKQALDAIYI